MGMVKEKNRLRICRPLKQYPNLSLMELSDKLDIDKSTVTVEVNKMVAQGLILEMPEGVPNKNGGRKPIPLSLNKDYGVVIGIAIQYDISPPSPSTFLERSLKSRKRISSSQKKT